MNSVLIQDLGLIDYKECWTLQEEFFERLIASKRAHGVGDNGQWPADVSEADGGQTLILCEHPHIYTLGKSGKENNLLIDPAFLKRIGATFLKVDRGGDITYHGPGQLVGYPILDLEKMGLGLKDYVHRLEEAIIGTLRGFGIMAGRCKGATGVWLGEEGKSPLRKIAAIGVRSSHFVTMHGFALNVDPAMEYFSYINPCGFTDRGVTSMSAETGSAVKTEDVKKAFTEEFGKVFGVVAQ